MPDPALSERRIAEVRSPGPGLYGTGYLLGPDLVLTAAHVLVDRAKPPEGPLRAEARTLAGRSGRREFVGASLAWPSLERLLDPAEPDLALLRLDQPEPGLAGAAPISLGLGNLRRDQSLSVTAVGFPAFRFERTERETVTDQIDGEVLPMAGIAAAPGASVYEIALKLKPKVDAASWKGMSGASLFAEDRLIGVVVVKIPDGGTLPTDFKALRLSEVENDAGFIAALRGAATFGAAPAMPPPPPLKQLLCLLDRDFHEGAFTTALRAVVEGNDARSLICIAEGPKPHLPTELQHRFRVKTLPDLMRWPPETSGFRVLSWPTVIDDPAAALAGLRGTLATYLAGLDGVLPADDAALRAALADETRPRLFWTDLRSAAFDPANAAGTAALMGEWFIFWAGLSGVRARPPVHVLVANDVEVPAIKTVLASVRVPPTLHLETLPRFEPCGIADLEDWLNFRLPPRLRPTDRHLLDPLGDHLRERFDAEFTYSDLRRAMSEYLAREAA